MNCVWYILSVTPFGSKQVGCMDGLVIHLHFLHEEP